MPRDKRQKAVAFLPDLPPTHVPLPTPDHSAAHVEGAIRKLEDLSLHQDSGGIDYQYDSETGETEIAPFYPTMAPVSTDLDDLQFLHDPLPGDGKIQITNPDGTQFTIDNLNIDLIERSSTVLASSFLRAGSHKIFLINAPQTAMIGFLRAVYQGDYTFCEAMLDRPVPLLLHLQILSLAFKFRAEQVTAQALEKALREIELAGTSGRPPLLDLCESVRYLYTELRHSHDLRRAIANYCLEFYKHHTGEIFRQTAYESPAFHRDLQQANFVDEFCKPYAAEITQLPVCGHWTHHHDMPAWKGANDFTCQFHPSEADDASGRTGQSYAQSPGSFTFAAVRSTRATVPSAMTPLPPPLIPKIEQDMKWDQSPNIQNFADSTSRPPPNYDSSFMFDNPRSPYHKTKSSPGDDLFQKIPRRFYRTKTPWLPNEEQEFNAESSFSQRNAPPLPSLVATLRNEPEHPLGLHTSSNAEMWNVVASKSSSHRKTSDRDSVDSQGQALPVSKTLPLRQALPGPQVLLPRQSGPRDSLAGDSSDSEWSMVETPVARESNDVEEASFSDSEWSEIGHPDTPRG